MDSQRWNRLQALFLEATELPASERAAFLAQAADDEPLREEVEEMLAAHDGDSALQIERLLHGEAPLPSPRDRIGSRIGPYRLIDVLGRGGMSEVFLAERDDAQYHQRVALKIVRRGFEHDDIVRRFRVERQVLARLVHPNIARLLDGGVTTDGLPYLVMEHVQGLPITRYCDEAELGVRARLRLFETVCRAVHFAHQNLIVHRDLKPANILVTDDGSVRLLDFGIAKLLAPEQLEVTVLETRATLRILTLEYASPEQIRGAPITTASDVYSLGVLLFELLAGAGPFDDVSGGDRALERAVLEREAPPPSEKAKPEVRGSLVGDLDNIVALSLRKEPSQRYRSADELGDDLRRYLEGLPVNARATTLIYRTGKFVRRHRLAVAASVAGVLLLAGFSIITALQARTVRQERDAARAERDKAQAVSRFLYQLFDANAFNSSGNLDTMTVRELLDASEGRVRGDLVDQPAVQATLFDLLGFAQANRNHLERARALAQESLALRRKLYGEHHLEVAESYSTLGTIAQFEGRYDEAEEHFRRTVALREELLGSEHTKVAEALHNLSVLLSERSHGPDAEEALSLEERSLAILRRLVGPEDLELARGLMQLAALLYHRNGPGDLERAIPLYREVLALRQRELGTEHPASAVALNNLAHALHRQGQLDEAEDCYHEAIRIATQALGEEHTTVSSAYFGLSDLLEDRGDLDGAEAALRRSMEIDRKTLPADHPYLEDSRKELAALLSKRAASSITTETTR